MDAKEYLNKVNEICKVYENSGQCNEKCPLKIYGCGAPVKTTDIDDVINVIADIKDHLFPFGKCKKCNKEFKSELISKYKITNCPWCGEPVVKT